MQIPAKLTEHFGRQVLTLQKHAPQILFAGGIVGTTASTVLACKATLRLDEVLTEHESKKELLNSAEARALPDEVYTDQDRKRDTALLYTQSTIKLVRLYGPAIMVGAISVGMLTKSNSILQERNTALMAAYTLLDNGFKSYRAKVVEKYGEEEDRELRYDTERVSVKDPETGRKKTVSRAVAKSDGTGIYEQIFDSQTSAEWHADEDYRLHWLSCQEAYFNVVLQSRGHIFLNEVRKALGFPHTKAGAVVGWIKGQGDDYVDIGIADSYTKDKHIIGAEDGAMLLDFNVDGVIYDKLDD